MFFLTAGEVADLLRLNLQVVQRKLQAGEIPAYRIGREWRVERGQLLAWLETRSNQRTPDPTARWFDRDGRLKAFPKQRAKRRAVLERLAELFDVGRVYSEREVNALLRPVFDDVALVRRELVAEGLVDRPRSGSYRRRRDTGRNR
jgi:excisionase family DNA binding protein